MAIVIMSIKNYIYIPKVFDTFLHVMDCKNRHIGTDSLTGYTGERFKILCGDGLKLLRTYSKDTALRK